MRTAFQMATSGTIPAMTIFWLKARAGWRDRPEDAGTGDDEPTPVKVEVTVKDASRADAD